MSLTNKNSKELLDESLYLSKWIDLEEYFDYLKGFSNTTVSVYYQSIWLNLIQASFGVKARGLVTLNSEGHLLAITPVMLSQKGPFKLLGSPLSGLNTSYSGPLFIDQLSIKQKENIIYSQHKLTLMIGSYIEWGINSPQSNPPLYLNKIENLGYTHIERKTLVLDISIGEENLWMSFKGRARTSIRKAKKCGVIVKVANSSEQWFMAYYEMLGNTFNKQNKVNPHPEIFFKNIQSLVDAGEAYCVQAEFEGRIIAAAIFLMDNKNLLYLSGTSNDEGMRYSASSLIQWKAMCLALSFGIINYDMNGLGIASIDKFKRGFGGREITNHRWVYKTKAFKAIEPIAKWMTSKGYIKIGRN